LEVSEDKYVALETAIKNNIITGEEARQLLIDYQAELITEAELLEIVAEKTEEYNKELEGVTSGLGYSKEAQRDFNWAMLDGVEATDDLAASQAELKQKMSDLKTFISGPLGKAYERFEEQQDDLEDEIKDVIKVIEEFEALGDDLTKEQRDELDKAKEKLGELNQAYSDNADAHTESVRRIMFNLLDARAAMDGYTEEEIAALNKIALQWGLLDQATFDYVTNADTYMQAVNATTGENMGFVELQLARVLGITQDSNAEFLTMRDRIAEIEGVHEIELRIKVTGTIPSIPKGGSFGGAIPSQHGLNFTVPGGYPNDSFFLPLAVTSGEHVQVTPRGRGRTGGAGARVIYNRGGDNIYIQSSAAAAFLVEKEHQAEFDEIDKVI
jgi:hypothetical protein